MSRADSTEAKEWRVDDGLTVTSIPLPYERSEDLLPDIMRIVSMVIDQAARFAGSVEGGLESLLKTEDPLKLAPILGPMLGTLGRELGGGELKRLAPLLLFSTTAVMPDETGQLETKELGKLKDRKDVFEAYPQHYFPIMFFAGRVTFARFFPARGLLALGKKTAKSS